MVVNKRRQISRVRIIPLMGIMLLAFAICMPLKVTAQEADPVPSEEVIENAAPENILPEDILLGNYDTDVDSTEVEEASFYQDQDYEDLILAVVVERENISPGIFAIQKNNRYYLPLAAIADLLTFHVEVDLERQLAEGWAITTDRSFVIDGLNNKITYQGRSADLPPEAVLPPEVATDDMYVQVEVLNRIWPLVLEVDLSRLVLDVIPDEQLPYQSLRERRKKQEALKRQKERREREKAGDLPFIVKPYQLFGKPSLDFQTQAGYDARRDSAVYGFSFSGVQDLAFASADYGASFTHVNGELDKPDNFRLRFTREDIHEGALPFGLEKVQWGDVNLRNRDLIATGSRGRGLTFTNRKRNQGGEFDQITVDGIATPGWETELYINNQLIDFGVVDSTGEYRFEDVSISYGNNRIRVVFYGPQGQIEERVENYFYQSSMLEPGKMEVSGGIVDAEKDLIPLDERDIASRPEGLASNLYAARGITRNLTAFASATTLNDLDEGADPEERRNYISAGAIASFDTTLAQFEAYKNLGEGQALDIRTLSDFFGFRVNTQASFYSNFESPKAGRNFNAKDMELEVNVKKNFSTYLGNLGLEAGADYLSRENGVATTRYTTRQSLGFSGTRITHQTTSTLNNNDHTSSTGRLDVSSRHQRWRLRNSLNYRFFPETKLASFQSELRYGTARDSSAALRFSQNFDNDETIAGVQLSHDFKKFLGSVEADWSSIYGASLMFRASASIGPYAQDGSYLMQSDPLRVAGPISSFVYRDNDYSGTYTEGDEPVPDTKIVVDGRKYREETDENGYLAILNNSNSEKVNVMVNESTIDDPYLIPGNDGYSMYPRPGVMHRLAFPLIETGAIDGTIRWSTGKPVAGLYIQLMGSDAEIYQTTQTAIDGYFTFERIPPGSYTIRADPESGINIPFKHVVITPDNMFQFGTDIDVVDPNSTMMTGLDTGIDNEGNILLKSIKSITNSFKEKKNILKQANAAPTVEAVESAAVVPQAAPQKQPVERPTIIEEIRIGQHPNKVRVVLDLSSPVIYTLSYDPNSNSLFLDMPYAEWAAKTSWQSKTGKILNNYRTERMNGSGMRLILGVEDDIEVGASGLLKASGGKKDRLYIDIEQK
jgi:hypothetical protein